MNENQLYIDPIDHDEFTVVKVGGTIILSNSDEFRQLFDTLLAHDTPGVALDFEGVEYMDSSALGVCAAVSKRLRDPDTPAFAIYGASPTIENLFQVIGLHELIPVFPDQDKALAWMREQTAK